MVRSLIRRAVRRFGYDLVRYQPLGTTVPTFVPGLLKRLDISLVADVGANTGGYAAMLRKQGYRGRIVSFEPVNDAFTQLEQAAAGDNLWTCCRCALGAQIGTAEMNVAFRNDFSSLLPPSKAGISRYGQDTGTVATEAVEVRRLDEMLDLHAPTGARVYLKMDTQGYDLHVIEGAKGWLRNIIALQSEVYQQPPYDGAPDYLSALGAIHELGFELARLFPGFEPWAEMPFADAVMVRIN